MFSFLCERGGGRKRKAQENKQAEDNFLAHLLGDKKAEQQHFLVCDVHSGKSKTEGEDESKEAQKQAQQFFLLI